MRCFVRCFAVFRGVFPVFCDDQREPPYLTRFVAHGQQFYAVVAIDRTTTESTRDDADQRKTTQNPHPFARDGSGIPLSRVYKMACVIGSMCVLTAVACGAADYESAGGTDDSRGDGVVD